MATTGQKRSVTKHPPEAQGVKDGGSAHRSYSSEKQAPG